MATALLSPFFLDLLPSCSSTWRCAYEHFTKPTTTLGLVEQAFWRVPLFTEWIGASSFDVILAWPSKHSSLRLLPVGLRVFDAFFHPVAWRTRTRIRLCHFCTLIDILTETAIVSSGTLPVELPLPTKSKNFLSTLFCSLILDHGVLLINSVSGLKKPSFVDSARYFLQHRLQYVIIRS